ncbi:MAG TPA: glutamate 5-kinase [Turneriella sp.]|nr:glutamate 5-kinase [Turneriella sp.]HNE19230.1 glutamate 5-kinase [Turneriella sp.]HNJ65394.1 glutamate 5-kinase [Turneriella sp.]HNL53076.1 glutamate 5-kinase [Turneriella sp.]HNM99316.1 glutamate 5-kinase [Turneriella sp.]
MNKTLEARIKNATHVVLKFGTGVLTEHIHAGSTKYFRQIAKECLWLQSQGKKVIIVSSGAGGFGRVILKKSRNIVLPNATLKEKQSLASLGQSLLIDTYRTAFAKENLPAAQILLTRTDFENKRHLQNLRATLSQLLDWGAVPVINENDAIANEEIKVGDNDNLSADIALLYPKSLLVLLTTIDGFYRNKERVPHIARVSADIKKHAGNAAEGGTGGMITKLQAAEKILRADQAMIIAAGKDIRIVRRILEAKDAGTWVYNA